jgi:hypothetical protein
MYQNKKNQLYERERKRWERMDYEYLKAENKIINLIITIIKIHII